MTCRVLYRSDLVNHVAKWEMIIVYSEKYNLHNKSNEVRDDILFDKVIIEPGASWVDQAT